MVILVNLLIEGSSDAYINLRLLPGIEIVFSVIVHLWMYKVSCFVKRENHLNREFIDINMFQESKVLKFVAF